MVNKLLDLILFIFGAILLSLSIYIMFAIVMSLFNWIVGGI